jgi:hypothetical protein
MSAPLELLAVRISPGLVTEKEWLEALADRVQELAEKAGPKASRQASKALGMPGGDPEDAGQNLVLGNWNLQEFLRAAVIDKKVFPAKAEYDPEALKALQETNLQEWVDLAASQVSGSDLG